MRGPASRGRCGRPAGSQRPVAGASAQPCPGRHQEAERRPATPRGRVRRPRQVHRPASASCCCRSRPRHASRRGGAEPARVEPCLRRVREAPPQVSTPGALGAVHWARHGHPATPRSLPGATLPPPPSAALLGPSHARTSTLSPTPHHPLRTRSAASRFLGLRDAGLRHVENFSWEPGAGDDEAEVATRGRRGNAWPRAASRRAGTHQPCSPAAHSTKSCPRHLAPAASALRPGSARAQPGWQEGYEEAQRREPAWKGPGCSEAVPARPTCVCAEACPLNPESRGKFGRRRHGHASPFPQARERIRCFQFSLRRGAGAESFRISDSGEMLQWTASLLQTSAFLPPGERLHEVLAVTSVRPGSAFRNKQAFSSGGRVTVWLTSVPRPS